MSRGNDKRKRGAPIEGTHVIWPKGVEARFGISAVTRWRWEGNGTLPPRDVNVGGRSGWSPAALERVTRAVVAADSDGLNPVHVMCAYLREECKGCPAVVASKYGDGEPGCFAMARETRDVAINGGPFAVTTANARWRSRLKIGGVT